MKRNVLKLFSLLICLAILGCLLPVSLANASAAETMPTPIGGNLDTAPPTKAELQAAYQNLSSTTNYYAEPPSTKAPYTTGKLTEENLQAALEYLNYLRRIANLPPVQLNEAYNQEAQYAAVVLAANNVLSHYPNQPADMDEEFYLQGYAGASSSNLGWGYRSLIGSLNGCIADDDMGNRDRVGHRRWLLSPEMRVVGFGQASSFTVTKVIGSENMDQLVWDPETESFVSDGLRYHYVSWPSSGNFPSNLISGQLPWSVTLNPDRYALPDRKSLVITITRKSDGKTWTVDNSTPEPSAGKGDFLTINNQGYGVSRCLIFRPAAWETSFSGVYTVKIDGLTYRDGTPAEFGYEIDFFDVEASTCTSHDYGVTETKPTCTQEGKRTKTCKNCGYTVTETLPATGHTEAIDPAQEPDCTREGFTEGRHCSVCNTVLAAQQTLPMTDHTWDEGTLTTKPTESQNGVKTFTCTICGKTRTEEYICPHENTKLVNETPAACKTDGYSGDRVCADCGKVLETGSVLPAIGHQWDEGTVIREPSCDQPGQLTYTCINCGNMTSEQIPALCGQFLKVDAADSIVTKGTTVKDPMTSSTETFAYHTPEDGVTLLIFFSHQCFNCKHLMSQLDGCAWMSNPYLDVVAVECVSSTAPPVMDFIASQTPNAAPLIDYFYAGNSRLAFSYYNLFSQKANLTWPVVVMISDDGIVRYGSDAVTSTYDLYNTLKCISPGFAAYENETTPTEPCTHTNRSVIGASQATCTTDGYTGDTVCSICHEVLDSGSVLPAFGHQWNEGTVTKEPTLDAEGEKVLTCTVCDEKKTESIPKLPPCTHPSTSVVNAAAPTCTAEGYSGDTVCSDCGETIATGSILPAAGHQWNEGAVTTEPTLESEGVKTSVCTVCSETKTEAIPQLPPCTHPSTATEKAAVPTCTAEGYSGDTVCTDCGDTIATGSILPAAGHQWDEGAVTTEPTLEGEGVISFQCLVCKETKTEVIPQLKPCTHPSTSVVNAAAPTCTAEGYSGDTICNDCGETTAAGSVLPATGHIWDNGTITTQPTVEAEGIKTFACTVCAETRTESIPKLTASGFVRIAGDNRFETAFDVANAMKQQLGIEKFDSVIVASGTNFADALSGSYLAAVKNAPILLSYNTEKINSSVKNYIKNNLKPGGTVYILGGTNAVSASMETGLDGFFIHRLAGNDRFGTNLAILAEAGIGDKDVLICTGTDFADSLSASAAKLPILLVWQELTPEQMSFLQTTTGSLYVIGGTSAVSDKLLSQAAAFGPTTRLGGSDRFETSVLIAETFFPQAQRAVLAYAGDFPDGLCGGSLAAVMDAPLILTMNCYEKTAAAYALGQGISRGFVLGGQSLICDQSLHILMGSGSPGHDFLDQVIAPTCTEQGYTSHTCQKCGRVTTDTKTPALGHSYDQTIVPPTFDQGGYTLNTCRVCGHTQKTDKTGTLDASYQDAWSLVNQLRKDAGIAPLEYCFEAQGAAEIRAEEIHTLWGSQRPNGEDARSVLNEIGLEWEYGTELLGMGYSSARELIQDWMSNPEYREVLLDGAFGRMILCHNGTGWVLILLD